MNQNYPKIAHFGFFRYCSEADVLVSESTIFLPPEYGEWIHQPVVPVKQRLYVGDGQKKKRKKTIFQQEKKPKKERYLLCKKCENRISKPDYRISLHGAIDHTFLNPAGQVFHIGCFKRADGCLVMGDASSEWTWFQGFQWQVAVCGQCMNHLGWFYFSEVESSFFGLILDALV